MGFLEYYLITIGYISTESKKHGEVMGAVNEDGTVHHSYDVIVKVEEDREDVWEAVSELIKEKEGLEVGFKAIVRIEKLEGVTSYYVLPRKNK